MGTVIVMQFVTRDGVVEDPDGSGGTPFGGWAFAHPEVVAGDKFALGGRLDGAVKVLGRSTWQLFAGLFPARTDPFSASLNGMEKLVVSRTLRDVDDWAHSTLLRGDLVDEVLRRRERQDVLVAGSTSVVEQLVAADVVDEYRLLVFPVALGRGRALPLPLSGTGPGTTETPLGHGIVRRIVDRRPVGV